MKQENDKTISEKTISLNKIDYIPTLKFNDLKEFKNYKVKKLLKENNQCSIFIIEDENKKEFILKVFYLSSPFNVETVKKIEELSKKQDFPPYLTKIIDSGYSQQLKTFYIIEEYLKFHDLSEYIKKNKLSKDQVKEFIYQMNEALNYLHKNDIIHRDIKPSNILISSLNPLVFSITDYNISSIKAEEANLKHTSFKLTPAYASPESFSNIVSPKSDYWSLGITVLELITQKNPFFSDNQKNIEPHLIIYKILSEDIPIPENTDPFFKVIIKNLLKTNPNERWSYQEVKDFLEGKEVKEKKDNLSDQTPSKISITINQKKYNSLEELLLSALKSEKEFKKAKDIINNPEIQKILSSEDKSFLKNIQNKVKDDELLLNLFILYKFPTLPLSVCSFKISPDSIKNIFKKLINKEILSYEESKVLNLIKNYLENRELNIHSFYNLYKEITKQSDKELETFLLNLKKIIVKPMVDINEIEKVAFTVLFFSNPRFLKPQSMQNFIFEREELPKYIQPVRNLLTIEEYNYLYNNLNPNHPEYKKMISLPYLPIETFLPYSEFFKNTLLSGVANKKQQRYQKILLVTKQYLMKYNIRYPELEYYLKSPEKITDEVFINLYDRALDMILSKVNPKGSGIPFLGVMVSFMIFIVALCLVIFSFVILNMMPIPYRYVYGEFIYILCFCGLFLLLLSPIVFIFLTLLQKGLEFTKKKYTKEDLRRLIESQV